MKAFDGFRANVDMFQTGDVVVTGRAKVCMQGLDILRDKDGVGDAVFPDCGGDSLGMLASDYVNRMAGAKGRQRLRERSSV